MVPERIAIGDRISYWKALRDPLSADIGVVQGRACTWVFDVGNGPHAAECLGSLSGPKRAVLSHFHQDHMGNWREAEFEALYQGTYTFRHTGAGEIVRESRSFEEEAVRLFPIPSCHAKGCIGMEVDGTWAFLGDAVYCSIVRHGREGPAYNVSLLAEEIRVLRGLRARYFLLSHDEGFVREKEDVLAELEEIYGRRDPKYPYIFVD